MIAKDEPARQPGPRNQLEQFVDRQATSLLDGQARGSSWAMSAMVALRRAAGGAPGADPDLWEVTMAGLEPQEAPDLITVREAAAFHALTLFAVHQQSRPQPMHVRGVGLGEAVRRLLEGTASDSLRTRFRALAGSADVAELVVHLRSIVQQLRAAGVPLDYGRLATQLATYHWESGRIRTRQRWGRELVRSSATEKLVDKNGDPE